MKRIRRGFIGCGALDPPVIAAVMHALFVTCFWAAWTSSGPVDRQDTSYLAITFNLLNLVTVCLLKFFTFILLVVAYLTWYVILIGKARYILVSCALGIKYKGGDVHSEMPGQTVSAVQERITLALVPGQTVYTRGAAAVWPALNARQDNTRYHR